MQVNYQVNTKKRDSKMDRLLGKYIDSGEVISVKQLPGDKQAYRIALAPTVSKELVAGIQKTLAKCGYRISVHKQVQRAVHRRSGSMITHGSKNGFRISSGSGRVLIAKTNYPNKPENPGGLPEPGGQKPKRRK